MRLIIILVFLPFVSDAQLLITKNENGILYFSDSALAAAKITGLATLLNSKQNSLGFTPYNSTNPSGYISAVPAQTFASLTSKPTTLSGYGITDAYPLSGNPSSFLVAADIANKLNTNGSAASLTNFPTFNQNTSGTAAGLSTPLSFANGGIGSGAATSATTGTMTVNMTTEMITITPTNACTFNASGGVTGQRVTFVITTSGVSSFVLTWGTNFRTTATLATGTTTAKIFCVTFLYNGSLWLETNRTAAM